MSDKIRGSEMLKRVDASIAELSVSELESVAGGLYIVRDYFPLGTPSWPWLKPISQFNNPVVLPQQQSLSRFG